MVLEEDEGAFIKRATQVARQEQVYLMMGMVTFHLGRSRPVEIKTVLINPSGEVVFTYIKNRLVPGFEASTTLPGDGRIRTADTPYGRIAAAICYDLDFPDLIRQTGGANTDVLFAPSSDWQTIGPLHFQIAVFRAIENGVYLVRPARWGLSGAVDPYGRTLAVMDHFTSQQRVMVAQVPIEGVRTIYARIGDLFAWLCMAGLLYVIAWEMLRMIQLN
jgi:apolipoprotein N-acyltransferase